MLEPVIVKMSDNKFMLGRNESLIIIEEILGKDLKLETSNTVIKWNSHPIVGSME